MQSQHSQPRRDMQQRDTVIPRFLSRGQTFRVVIGDTLVLPCDIQDLGKLILLFINTKKL
jgi:hypothetical protein